MTFVCCLLDQRQAKVWAMHLKCDLLVVLLGACSETGGLVSIVRSSRPSLLVVLQGAYLETGDLASIVRS